MAGGGKSGGGDYWPGFVDALTNVVIAMVFVIVVLAIALSFSAQMLAKRMATKFANQQAQLCSVKLPEVQIENSVASTPLVESQTPQRTRIQVVGNEVGQAASAAGPQVKRAEHFFQLDFAPGAVTLDDKAVKALSEALEPLKARMAELPSLRLDVVAVGPESHLSENQRSAFIRAMAVRNELLNLGVASDRISLRIDTKISAAAPAVAVRLLEKP